MKNTFFNHLPEGTYYVSDDNYSGISRIENQRVIVHPTTGSKNTLTSLQGNFRQSTLTNTKISKKIGLALKYSNVAHA